MTAIIVIVATVVALFQCFIQLDLFEILPYQRFSNPFVKGIFLTHHLSTPLSDFAFHDSRIQTPELISQIHFNASLSAFLKKHQGHVVFNGICLFDYYLTLPILWWSEQSES